MAVIGGAHGHRGAVLVVASAGFQRTLLAIRAAIRTANVGAVVAFLRGTFSVDLALLLGIRSRADVG